MFKITEVDVPRDENGAPKTNRHWGEYEPGYRGRPGRTRMNPRKDTPAGKTRAYVYVKNESLLGNLANRTTRPHTEWAPFVKQALIEAGWPKTITLRWSQKAGCSCPCSPAFFVTGGPIGIDVHITLDADTAQTTDPELAEARAAQVLADPTMPDLSKVVLV